jgi:hypothetical protein
MAGHARTRKDRLHVTHKINLFDFSCMIRLLEAEAASRRAGQYKTHYCYFTHVTGMILSVLREPVLG